MVIQEVLFPNPETCSSFEMYFRTDAAGKRPFFSQEARLVNVPQWTHLDLDTYFNGFSIGKWQKYTLLDNLKLCLELQGEFHVQLIHWKTLKGESSKTVLAERICRAEKRTFFELGFPCELAERGIYACSLYAVGQQNAFYGGFYATEMDEDRLNNVDIAIDICTFRREVFVERNIAMLNRDIIGNPDSELRGHLDVFISDNGRTLDATRLRNEHVHIFANRNVGGAGGFTRGMMEILDYPVRFSHVLVMDDDVLINSDAIIRTYRLLRLLKPEYAGKTIAGAMLRLDNRHIQFECCATWNGYEPLPCKHLLDLREAENVLYNEQEETISFNGWWYSCIPMAKISNESLPLPLFVHRDDVEFGLRTGSDVLSLNGICLWHESFDNKYVSSMEYYEVRNDMITNALHLPGFSGVAAAWSMLRRIIANVIRYRYNNCALIFRGVDDFCGGPEFLMTEDAEALHEELMEASDKLLPLDQLSISFDEQIYRQSIDEKAAFVNVARIFLLNGIFLPARGTNIVNAATCWPRNCYRKKAILNYDELTQCGFVTKRSFTKTFAIMFKALGKAVKLARCYDRVCESYRQAQARLTSREFWEEYLKLK